jgi:hypothetical protein
MARLAGSTGRYAPESGPIMLTLSFVVHDPTETWGVAVIYLAEMPRNVNIHAGSRVIGKVP